MRGGNLINQCRLLIQRMIQVTQIVDLLSPSSMLVYNNERIIIMKEDVAQQQVSVCS